MTDDLVLDCSQGHKCRSFEVNTKTEKGFTKTVNGPFSFSEDSSYFSEDDLTYFSLKIFSQDFVKIELEIGIYLISFTCISRFYDLLLWINVSGLVS